MVSTTIGLMEMYEVSAAAAAAAGGGSGLYPFENTNYEVSMLISK